MVFFYKFDVKKTDRQSVGFDILARRELQYYFLCKFSCPNDVNPESE